MDNFSRQAIPLSVSVNSLKERICSYRAKFFPLRVNPFFKKDFPIQKEKWQERAAFTLYFPLVVYVFIFVCFNKVLGLATLLKRSMVSYRISRENALAFVNFHDNM